MQSVFILSAMAKRNVSAFKTVGISFFPVLNGRCNYYM